MDTGRILDFTHRRFGWVVIVVVLANAALIAGLGWFVWKLVAMATGH